MDYPNNYLKYPQNVLKPRQIKIDGITYTIHAFRFNGLNDLYNYLKSDPQINRVVWKENYKIASLNKNLNFYGIPYEMAVEDLIAPPSDDYKKFLKIEKNFDAKKGTIHKYETKKEIAGGKINIPSYTAGSPLCYTTSKIITKPKFVTVNVTLSYNCQTTASQVLNRAIIITSIINSLEKSGYTVNVNAFQLDEVERELFYMVFKLKRYGESINYPALYKSLCKIEFLRRISFRVLETSNVKASWYRGYGRTCSRSTAEQVLKLSNNDLYFDQPLAMDIDGYKLVLDFEYALNYLDIEDLVDTNEMKKEFIEKVKTLKKNI